MSLRPARGGRGAFRKADTKPSSSVVGNSGKSAEGVGRQRQWSVDGHLPLRQNAGSRRQIKENQQKNKKTRIEIEPAQNSCRVL